MPTTIKQTFWDRLGGIRIVITLGILLCSAIGSTYVAFDQMDRMQSELIIQKDKVDSLSEEIQKINIIVTRIETRQEALIEDVRDLR